MWKEWVDAVMGFIAGYNDRDGEKVKYERKIGNAHLRHIMVALYPLARSYDEVIIEINSVGVWM